MRKDVVAWIGLGLSILGLVFTAGVFYNRVTVVENAVEDLQKRPAAPADPCCQQVQRDVEKLRTSVGAIRDQLIYHGWNPEIVPPPAMPEDGMRMPPLVVPLRDRPASAPTMGRDAR